MQAEETIPIFEDADSLAKHLGGLLRADCIDHEQIDNALREYLGVASTNGDLWQCTEDYPSTTSAGRFVTQLLRSQLFLENRDYVRRQLIYCILQEDDLPTLHLTTAVLLEDGRDDFRTFQMMQEEGVFSRLLGLLRSGEYDDTLLHKLLLDLLCDMSRIQRLSLDDLETVDDDFILYLFELIEQLSNDASDPYHYTIIRLLYMCADSDHEKEESALDQGPRPMNRIVAILSHKGPSYRTFGENLILLLNRETGLSAQLLILKMLYLLFSNPLTYEYFYTNDLHVLVDVIIRNLLDLDTGHDGQDTDGRQNFALRHTYLRVLYPLLRNTQLANIGAHYKRNELRRLFQLLVNADSVHFAPVDDTVIRLVTRCKQVGWIADPSDTELAVSPASELCSPATLSETTAKNKLLGMHLAGEGISNLSVASVAAQIDKKAPAVPPPRRRGKTKTLGEKGNGVIPQLKVPRATRLPEERARARSPFAHELDEH